MVIQTYSKWTSHWNRDSVITIGMWLEKESMVGEVRVAHKYDQLPIQIERPVGSVSPITDARKKRSGRDESDEGKGQVWERMMWCVAEKESEKVGITAVTMTMAFWVMWWSSDAVPFLSAMDDRIECTMRTVCTQLGERTVWLRKIKEKCGNF